MNKSTLYGEEYSYLIPLLLCNSEEGYVHSRFSNGFNIQMGNSLIFIGNKKNGLLPFGIHLREEDTSFAVSSIMNNEFVKWNESKNSIEFSNVSITLEKGKPFNNELIPMKSRQTFERSFHQFTSLLMNVNVKTGLDVSINKFLKKFENVGNHEWDEVETFIIKLIEAAISNDEMLMDKVLKYFLGRGQGLTPSGDDTIVGFLAFDAISHFLSEKFYDKISKKIEGESITTDVAREYLRYALRREYSSTVTNVVNSIASGNKELEMHFKKLLGVGHSSGLDTLLGILIGMLTFEKMNNTEY